MNTRHETGLIRIRELHFLGLDRAFFRRGTFRLLENETGPVIHRDLLRLFRDRVPDRLQRDPQLVPDFDRAVQPVEMKIERDETGLVDRR